MKAESIVFAVAGMCFGVILGWVIGTQQATVRPAPAPAEAQSTTNQASQAPVLDEAKVQQYLSIVNSDPKNVGALVQLANTYFDGQKYPDAIKYYEQALTLQPNNVDASTDLGVSYYYASRPDDALKQFEVSLKLNPKHTKTLLNKGIVLAFGKQDLDGAAQAWKQVVDLAPGTPEAEAARRGLDGINAQRGNAATPPAGS